MILVRAPLSLTSDEMGSFMSATNVITGGCYCGEVRYQCVEGQPFRGLCYCRTCQTISGGAVNLFMAVDAQTFKFTKGVPRTFNKRDHPWSPTRYFCGICGVHVTARSERAPSAVLLKVGTLDLQQV